MRRLAPNNINDYFAIRLRALKFAQTAFQTTYAEETANGPDHFKVSLRPNSKERAIFGAFATEDGVDKIVATVSIYKETRPTTSHKAFIWGVYVDEAFRGQGLSAKLMDLAIDFAKRKLKVRAIYLSVAAKNTSAEKIYAAKGFKVWGVEPLPNQQDDVYDDEK